MRVPKSLLENMTGIDMILHLGILFLVLLGAGVFYLWSWLFD